MDAHKGTTLRTIDIEADAGTAFDGKHLYQIAGERIQKVDPQTGRVVDAIPAPPGLLGPGLGRRLPVGGTISRTQDSSAGSGTGKVLRTIESDRFVTGVTWLDGELWHGTWEDDASDLRQIDVETGAVITQLEMPAGTGVSGLESDGRELFYCGGGASGKIRVVRRPA